MCPPDVAGPEALTLPKEVRMRVRSSNPALRTLVRAGKVETTQGIPVEPFPGPSAAVVSERIEVKESQDDLVHFVSVVLHAYPLRSPDLLYKPCVFGSRAGCSNRGERGYLERQRRCEGPPMRLSDRCHPRSY